MKGMSLLRVLLFAVVTTMAFSFCSKIDEDWRIFSHPKGWQRSDPTPYKISKWPERFVIQVMFDSTCKYVFYNKNGTIAENQFDYNKAGGWSFKIGDAREFSCMMGWRYGVGTKKIELTFYHHNDWIAVHHTDPVALAGFYQVITYTMIPDYFRGKIYEQIEVGGVTQENAFDMAFIATEKDKIGREINCSFGGQESAPHRMFIFKKRIK